jgi:hypothetical protein
MKEKATGITLSEQMLKEFGVEKMSICESSDGSVHIPEDADTYIHGGELGEDMNPNRQRQTLKPYLLIDEGAGTSMRYALLSLKIGKIVSRENHVQYLYEDFGEENIHHTIAELGLYVR